MNNYKICPHCELNYILEHEQCCMACNPKNRGRLISDAEREYEAYRDEKWEAYKLRKQANEDFYAYRYNRKNNG